MGVRSQLVISDLNVDMLYFEQLLIAKVIYDDATEYEVNIMYLSCTVTFGAFTRE